MRSISLWFFLALQQTAPTPTSPAPSPQKVMAPRGLIEAAQKGDIQKIRTFAEDPGFGEKDSKGRTVLIAAGEKGKKAAFAELVAILDERVKKEVKRMIAEGQPAVSDGMAAVRARMLLFNTSDPKGRTPLMYAARHGWTDIISGMLQGAADPSLRDNEGRSAADHAQAAGYGSIASMLRNPPR